MKKGISNVILGKLRSWFMCLYEQKEREEEVIRKENEGISFIRKKYAH